MTENSPLTRRKVYKATFYTLVLGMAVVGFIVGEVIKNGNPSGDTDMVGLAPFLWGFLGLLLWPIVIGLGELVVLVLRRRGRRDRRHPS